VSVVVIIFSSHTKSIHLAQRVVLQHSTYPTPLPFINKPLFNNLELNKEAEHVVSFSGDVLGTQVHY